MCRFCRECVKCLMERDELSENITSPVAGKLTERRMWPKAHFGAPQRYFTSLHAVHELERPILHRTVARAWWESAGDRRAVSQR